MEKILFYQWDSVVEPVFLHILQSLNLPVISFSMEIQDYDMDPIFAMELMMKLNQGKIDIVVSFNYFPIIASVCNVCNVKYVSWVYDSPHLSLFSKTIFYNTNYVFVFDRATYERLRKMGISTVYYMSLGADIEGFQKIINGKSELEKRKYDSEVTFLGTLYNNKYNFYNQLEKMSDIDKKKVDSIIAEQKYLYGQDVIRERLTEKLIKDVSVSANLFLGDTFYASQTELVTYLLQKEVTAEERYHIMKEVSEKYRTRIYTADDTSSIPKLENCGFADYHGDMPLIFNRSKINLNITLRSIETGIPLRVLDIMSCGGFLLSNFQQELADYFEDGKELVLFHSKEDLLDKIGYYLEHEAERKQIAANGYQKVHDVFDYQRKVIEMINIANGV